MPKLSKYYIGKRGQWGGGLVRYGLCGRPLFIIIMIKPLRKKIMLFRSLWTVMISSSPIQTHPNQTR